MEILEIHKRTPGHLLALLTFILLFSLPATAQQLKGKVVDSGNPSTALVGASVAWLGTTSGTTADEKGNFILDFTNSLTPQIVVSYIGYKTDTIQVSGLEYVTVKLSASGTLREVVV